MNRPMDYYIQALKETAEMMESLRLGPPQGGQPAEPVEGATALEDLIMYFNQNHPFEDRMMDELVQAARQEAANRRPSTGKEGDVRMPEREETKLTSPESTPASRGVIPSTRGEDERDKKDWAQKLADKIHSAPWTPGETRELILRHLPAPSHSEVEPPWAKLIQLCLKLKRGCYCDYDYRCSNCDTIIEIKKLVAALNGESK